MNKVIETFASPNGSMSMMRVIVSFVVVAILVNWCYLTIHTGVKQPLDWTEVATILGALGVKAAQRPFESKPNELIATATSTTPQ